jgi:hypothetical protein
VGTDLGSFSVSSPTWSGPVPAGDRQVFTWKATLAAFETGDLEVPEIEVTYASAGGRETVRTPKVGVHVASVLKPSDRDGAEAELADLKPPASIPADYRPLLVALAALAGLLLLALLVWWLHRRYASRFAAVPAPEDPFRRLPPHVWAYAELKALLERRIEDDGDPAAFFAELTRILKRYLGGRYRTDLMESTTEEVLPALEDVSVPREPARGARALLEAADRVKFARERPRPGARREAVEAAYRIVDQTKPVEAAAADAEEGAA